MNISALFIENIPISCRKKGRPASATRRLGRLPASGDAAIPEPAQQTVEKRKGRPNRDCDCDRG